MFLHSLIPNICIYGYRFWKWRRFGWYWWVCLSISGEVWLYKEWKNQKTWCLLHGWKLEIFKRCSSNSFEFVSKRGSRGGGTGGPDPPPWDLSEVGSCVEAWWVGEGVQRLFLPYYSHFFFGSLRSPVLYKHITFYTYYKLNVQYGTVILSLYPPYPNYDKNPTFNPLLLGIFILFLSRITRFYTI